MILILPLVCFALFAWATVYCITASVKDFKLGERLTLKMFAVSETCILFTAVLCILNFGWLRAILIISGACFVHAAAILFFNVYTARYEESSPVLKIVSLVTFLLGYVLFPDRGDGGNMYAFFGLVTNTDGIESICFTVFACISIVSLIVNIVVCIMQAVSVIGIYEWVHEKNKADKTMK